MDKTGWKKEINYWKKAADKGYKPKAQETLERKSKDNSFGEQVQNIRIIIKTGDIRILDYCMILRKFEKNIITWKNLFTVNWIRELSTWLCFISSNVRL